MYVCVCAAVTERAIRGCIAAGASTVEELGERCQAGTGCGTCVDRLHCLLTEAVLSAPSPYASDQLPHSA